MYAGSTSRCSDAALPGTTPPDNAEWVRRKTNVTVFRFHRSSYAIGLELQEKPRNRICSIAMVCRSPIMHVAWRMLSESRGLAALRVVAAVTVSGLLRNAPIMNWSSKRFAPN